MSIIHFYLLSVQSNPALGFVWPVLPCYLLFSSFKIYLGFQVFIYLGLFFFCPALWFPLLPSSGSNDPRNEYWNGALTPGSWCCWESVLLGVLFLLKNQQQDHGQGGPWVVLPFPRTAWQVLKQVSGKHPPGPFYFSLFKSFPQ